MSWKWRCTVAVSVACAGPGGRPTAKERVDTGPNATTSGTGDATTPGWDSGTGEGSGSGSGSGTPWLAWSGADILTVDVFADGVPDCVFWWSTAGIQVSSVCDDCEFAFEVTRTPDPERSTCDGAATGLDLRWMGPAGFYVDEQLFDSAALVGNVFFARRVSLDTDPSYGAQVAITHEVQASLR